MGPVVYPDHMWLQDTDDDFDPTGNLIAITYDDEVTFVYSRRQLHAHEVARGIPVRLQPDQFGLGVVAA